MLLKITRWEYREEREKRTRQRAGGKAAENRRNLFFSERSKEFFRARGLLAGQKGRERAFVLTEKVSFAKKHGRRKEPW